MEKILTERLDLARIQTNNGQIEGVPPNPRFIRDERFEALKRSLRDFPAMIELREIVVYPLGDAFVAVGGNMRLLALREIGETAAVAKIIPASWPVERIAEFAIKDNVGFGQDDTDILANEWTDFDLEAWGMENIPSIDDEEPPDDFDDLDENIPTEHECPKCGYKWSGASK